MSRYEAALLAAGIPPQTARRDAWADSVQWFNNRERYAAEYAREQARDAGDYEPMNYADRRGV